MKWRRYRFKTRHIHDVKPLITNPKYPWWNSGISEDSKGKFAMIVAYLPINEEIHAYWDDAYEIDFTDHREIIFTSRFSKPLGYEE